MDIDFSILSMDNIDIIDIPELPYIISNRRTININNQQGEFIIETLIYTSSLINNISSILERY